jgi:hypothetical protein
MSAPVKLHVVAFDVPYPPDYGGVIDVFYKMKALHAQGVKIILHCYEYGRKPAAELEKYTEKVFYYPRQTAKSLLFNTYPYIVLTRNSPELKARLLEDDFPIMMEGLHSTFFLNDPAFSNRKTIVRTHNVEHDYYNNLARIEKNIFKRYYFYNEAGKLLKYESVLHKATAIAAISPADTAHFMRAYKGVHYITAFHPFDDVNIKQGKSDFAFYHGNLSVGENNEAALYLVEKIFNDLPYRLVVAGNKPSEDLVKAVSASKNAELKSNLTFQEIQELITKAQCNILPTFQTTGIKLKLIASLFIGRTCIVNTPMVINTGLESLCEIADSPEEMKNIISETMNKNSFEKQLIEKRKDILNSEFSNREGAKKLLKCLQ